MATSYQSQMRLDEGRDAVVSKQEVEMTRKYKRVAMTITGALFIGGVINFALPVQDHPGPVAIVNSSYMQFLGDVAIQPHPENESRFASVPTSAFTAQQTKFREPIY